MAASFPFIGPTYTTQSRRAGVERLVNLYVEVTESPGAPVKATYYGRPGLEVEATLPDAPGRGIFAQDGRYFAVAGGTFLEITYPASGVVATVRGAVANDGRPVTMCSNGANGHQVFVVSAGHGYIFDLVSSAFVEVTANFPPGAIQGGFLDGYFIAVWADHFQISARLDGLTWAADDVARPSISSDALVAMAINHRELWLFGERTTEVWYDAGADVAGIGSAFPFAPIPGVFLDWGIGNAPWSVTSFDGSVAWLGMNRAGARVVVRAEQYTPTRISTHAVEWALLQYPSCADVEASSYQEGGHTFLVLTSRANGATWVYDAAVPAPFAWAERSYWNQTTGQEEAIRARGSARYGGAHRVLDRDDGRLYRQALGLYTDAGVPIRASRRLPHVQDAGPMLAFGEFELGLEAGVGLTGDGAGGPLGFEPQLMLRWSDDGGFTWSSEHWTSAGRRGRYRDRAVWRRLGQGRNRVFEVVQTDPVKRAWLWATIDARPGLS